MKHLIILIDCFIIPFSTVINRKSEQSPVLLGVGNSKSQGVSLPDTTFKISLLHIH